ncbi:MAG: hypothetical protein GXO35_00685 [Gammaproteobacteria bacterium]|nr:hypothetical protein [Gammaproteobacteria bacterium]
MQYQVTEQEQSAAKMPHHIFNLNVILTHLAISQVALELGHGSPYYFILVPLISIMVLSYILFKSKQLAAQKESWFVAANWLLAWRRGRVLIASYIVAIVIMVLSSVIGDLIGGGLMMNDFSTNGSSTPIHEKITMFLSAVVVFVTMLIMFLQTGISVYDAGKGIIDPSIEQFIPRDETANAMMPDTIPSATEETQK